MVEAYKKKKTAAKRKKRGVKKAVPAKKRPTARPRKVAPPKKARKQVAPRRKAASRKPTARQLAAAKAAAKAERAAARRRAQAAARRKAQREEKKREEARRNRASERASVLARRRKVRAADGAAAQQRASLAARAAQALAEKQASERESLLEDQAQRRIEIRAAREQFETESKALIRSLLPSARLAGLQNLRVERNMIVATGRRGTLYRPYRITNARTHKARTLWTYAQTLDAYVSPEEMVDQYEDLDQPAFSVEFFDRLPSAPPAPRTLAGAFAEERDALAREHAAERRKLRTLLLAEKTQASTRAREQERTWNTQDEAWRLAWRLRTR